MTFDCDKMDLKRAVTLYEYAAQTKSTAESAR